MSEDKFIKLIKLYPDYSNVFQAVLNWFLAHPKQKYISMDLFYSNKYAITKEQLNVAFYIMKESKVVKPVYRILDENGHKIGRDYEDVTEIPKHVSTMLGDKKSIDDVFVVNYYTLI
ncbi:hypothetical protein FMM05_17470 [Flavobacterium zepuense]|uniref:Uncharacterized protein n=1 Tax=Flavobacterium zepuense TaxID=2593302 RepID=A0A552UVR9_9FLAO|nr:hypothetical protein [Flavobacterium zepuense]TRW22295.1 hypothetical protein FMM05_17470 [Flavobacterium zepuense]